LSLKNIFWVSP